jgi:predicted ester cyclase
MSNEEKKDVARRMLDAFARGDTAAFSECATPEFTRLAMEEWRPAVAKIWGDASLEVTDAVAEGDRVWALISATNRQIGEYKGLPATGKTSTIRGVGLMRLEGNKIAEFDAVWDDLSRIEQLGGVIVPGAAAVSN